jgi:hypothetical protein
MSALDVCFNSISTIQSVSYNQYASYKTCWETFRSVELYNSNVSTQRGQGNKTISYYQYPDSTKQSQYKQGGALFAFYLGYSTIVQKN